MRKSTALRNENREASLLDFIEDYRRFPGYVDEYETLLTDNRIWKQRLVGIGVVSPERAKALGFTDPCCAVPGWSGISERSSLTRYMTGWI
jgi:NADH-quinone oxidoreductase subunit D